jgi:hypothetical protein
VNGRLGQPVCPEVSLNDSSVKPNKSIFSWPNMVRMSDSQPEGRGFLYPGQRHGMVSTSMIP